MTLGMFCLVSVFNMRIKFKLDPKLHRTIYNYFLSVAPLCFLKDGRCGQCMDIQKCPSTYIKFLDGEEIQNVCYSDGILLMVCCPFEPDYSKTPNFNDKVLISSEQLSQKSKYNIFLNML